MLVTIFEKVLNMSLVGSYVIGIVLLVRVLLRKCERKYAYLLWFVVFLNLCLPISIYAPFSLVPQGFVEETGEVAAEVLYLGEKEAIIHEEIFSAENNGDTISTEEESTAIKPSQESEASKPYLTGMAPENKVNISNTEEGLLNIGVGLPDVGGEVSDKDVSLQGNTDNSQITGNLAENQQIFGNEKAEPLEEPIEEAVLENEVAEVYDSAAEET